MMFSGVKHIDGNNHRNLHFDELSCQIKISFEIGSIDDIDDKFCFIFKNSAISTVFMAHVFKGSVEQTGTALTALGTIK